jgi:hypothetical protein
MAEVYFPPEIFNLIKAYADIDPLKHNQKKLNKILFEQLLDEKWQHSDWSIDDNDMGEDFMMNTQLIQYNHYEFGREEERERYARQMVLSYYHSFMTDKDANDYINEYCGVYRNDAQQVVPERYGWEGY